MSQTKTGIRIHLRHDQSIANIGTDKNNDQNVKIFAPLWLREGLNTFRTVIPKGTELEIMDRRGQSIIKSLENDLSLKDLIMIARNESSNVSGRVDFNLYTPLIADRPLIYSLKDLVRQTIIIGRDETKNYGGYGSQGVTPQKKPVILIDSIGLQFQQKYNTGRLVLIGHKVDHAPLDELIFTKVVGEPKKTLEEVRASGSPSRFIQTNGVFFDTYAYEMFVAQDMLLVGCALNKMDIPEVNLKFLKYGTGFFAGSYQHILVKHISSGVYRGMKTLFESGLNTKIKSFEFPFYEIDPKIWNLCKKYEIECRFSTDDALKQSHPTLITATTNCADPHSVTGNEMGYSSVDAAIAQNIKSKANKFSPLLNQNMSEEFIDLPLIQSID